MRAQLVAQAFLLGVIVTITSFMFWQDMLGQEAWLLRVEHDWVELSPWVGGSLAVWFTSRVFRLAFPKE